MKKRNRKVFFTPKPPKTGLKCPVEYCAKELSEYELFRTFCTKCRNSFKLLKGEPVIVTLPPS